MDNNSSAAGDSTESSELGRMSLDDSNNSGNGVDSDAQKMLETLSTWHLFAWSVTDLFSNMERGIEPANNP